MSRMHYSDEMCAFLRDSISSMSYRQLTQAFNERYGVNLQYKAILHKCQRLGIDHGKKCEFKKGSNNPCSSSLPIGAEVVSAGKVYVKVDDKPTPSGRRTFGDDGNFVQKNRYVYEKHYGKIPKGLMVVSLVNDRNNFEPQNLYATTRKVNMMMCANKWYTESREHTLTALKWCELFYAMRGE